MQPEIGKSYLEFGKNPEIDFYALEMPRSRNPGVFSNQECAALFFAGATVAVVWLSPPCPVVGVMDSGLVRRFRAASRLSSHSSFPPTAVRSSNQGPLPAALPPGFVFATAQAHAAMPATAEPPCTLDGAGLGPDAAGDSATAVAAAKASPIATTT